ncbi:hypothetical protein JCM17960_19940 [Magnetospira thiophila]
MVEQDWTHKKLLEMLDDLSSKVRRLQEGLRIACKHCDGEIAEELTRAYLDEEGW